MDHVTLGTSDLSVSRLGLGCMGMSEFYGESNEAENMAVFQGALDAGVNFFDTADMYGVGKNEELVGRALRKVRDQVVIATKFGIRRGEGGERLGVSGRPEYVRQAAEASLKRLGTDHIDLYYQHRVDPDVPIEDTVGAMSELVSRGLVRYLGLSEALPEQIRRAHRVHPITALQTEYSLWTRDPEETPEDGSESVLATTRDLNIAFVAYSPLGRGFLTGAITSPDDFEEGDFRKNNPRFQGENFQKNLRLVDAVRDLARQKDCTPAQLALAWLLAQGQDIVPIPGTKRVQYLIENLGALNVQLSEDDLAQLAEIAPIGVTAGERYAQTPTTRGR